MSVKERSNDIADLPLKPFNLQPKPGTQAYLVVDVLDACLTGANITAAQSQCTHSGQGQLTQVALLHTTRHQRHGDVTLDAVHAHPWRYKRKDTAFFGGWWGKIREHAFPGVVQMSQLSAGCR